MSATSLAGHLLIAMPALADPHFARTVTYLCEHNEYGALGVTVNRPLDMTLSEVLEQYGLATDDALVAGQPVYAGGPVQAERGFVLHDAGREYDATLPVDERVAVTASRDVLEALAAGTGPGRVLVALGYAGWAPGQLEQELADNAWLHAPCAPELLFTTPSERRWHAAAAALGIDLGLLAGHAGHA